MKSSRDYELLIVGFGPFPGVPSNPSGDCARLLSKTDKSARCAMVIPSSYERAPQAVLDCVDDVKPKGVLLLGYSGHVRCIRLEAIARNHDRAKSPDVDQVMRRGQVEAGGPPQLVATADFSEIERRLDEGKADYTTSLDAGGYVCNHVYYRVLRHIQRVQAPGPTCLFVHIGNPESLDNVMQALTVIADVLVTSEGKALKSGRT